MATETERTLAYKRIVGTLGYLRRVQRDGEWIVTLVCPACGQRGDIDDDQLHGRVSIICPCGFHETRDWWRTAMTTPHDFWPWRVIPALVGALAERQAFERHVARVEADQAVRLAEPWDHAPYTCYDHGLTECDSADCWALRIVGDETGDLLDFDGCPGTTRDAVAYLYDGHQRAVGDEGATYDELVVTRWLLAEARWYFASAHLFVPSNFTFRPPWRTKEEATRAGGSAGAVSRAGADSEAGLGAMVDRARARGDRVFVGPRLSWWRRVFCFHEVVRCAHGGEVARLRSFVVCVMCGRARRHAPRPSVCYFTGRAHEVSSLEGLLGTEGVHEHLLQRLGDPDRQRSLALDLATLLVRIEQMQRQDVDQALVGLNISIWGRIITCDVPRLREHLFALDPKILALLAPEI